MDRRDSAYNSYYSNSTTDSVYESIDECVDGRSTEPHDDNFDDSDFDSEEWDDSDYENYDNDTAYVNDAQEWTNPAGNNHLDVPIAAPQDDGGQTDDYLAPQDLAIHRASSSPFMEPGHTLSGPPSRRPPALPPTPVEEPAPPPLTPRGRGPLPMPPREQISAPAKVLPPAPPVAAAPKPAAVVSPSPAKVKPTPPQKPNSKIHQLASAFEKKQESDQPRPPIAKKPVKKPTPTSFLHQQAKHMPPPRVAQPPMQNGSAVSSDDDGEGDYQPVDDIPIEHAPTPSDNRPPLPARDASDTPASRPGRDKGLVSIFPGMPTPDTIALRKTGSGLTKTLEGLFGNNKDSNGPNGRGRKGSTPTVSPMKPPQRGAAGGRKGSEPVIQTTPRLPQGKFKKQVSVDQLNDRPLPAPPGGVPSPTGRNPADRPLPPVPSAVVKPPSPPIQSQPKIQSPPIVPGGTRGPRTDRPLPAVPHSEEEMTIYSYPWYFGDMDRSEASNKIKAQFKEGVFLVRKSTSGGFSDPYTLIFFDGNKVHNLHIRRRPDNKYALGKEKDNELTFRSVPDLIQFHQSNAIALAGGARTVLTTCPSRQ